MADAYQTIEKTAFAEFKDRGSKFIAYAYPIQNTDQFKMHLVELKKANPKAVHFCFAYRLGLGGNNFRVSDDGEPSGSAGRPILGQIDSKEITNTAVIVVRYFGGTLLGVPGLINAYKTATIMALQLVPIVEKAIEINYELQCNYTHLNDVMTICKQFGCTVLGQEQQLFCLLRVGIPKARLNEVLFKLNDMHHVDIKLLPA